MEGGKSASISGCRLSLVTRTEVTSRNNRLYSSVNSSHSPFLPLALFLSLVLCPLLSFSPSLQIRVEKRELRQVFNSGTRETNRYYLCRFPLLTNWPPAACYTTASVPSAAPLRAAGERESKRQRERDLIWHDGLLYKMMESGVGGEKHMTHDTQTVCS